MKDPLIYLTNKNLNFVMQAIVDHYTCSLDVYVAWLGSIYDACIF